MSGASKLTLQEITTAVPGNEVLARAKSFFASRPSIYAAFLDMEAPSFCSFRGQGGEEIIIGVTPTADGTATRVTGSSYLFDMQVARFLTTLESEVPA